PGDAIRIHDSAQFPYTPAALLPAAKQQFATEFAARLAAPRADPVETAAWVEWRALLTDHFWADGAGRAARLLAAVPLARAGLPLPAYRGADEYFAHAARGRYDPRNGGGSYLDGAWERFRDYYRTLFPPGVGAPPRG